MLLLSYVNILGTIMATVFGAETQIEKVAIITKLDLLYFKIFASSNLDPSKLKGATAESLRDLCRSVAIIKALLDLQFNPTAL